MHSVHSHAQFATLNAFRALQVWDYYCGGRNLSCAWFFRMVFVGSSIIFQVEGPTMAEAHTMVTRPCIDCGLQQQVWQFLDYTRAFVA